MIYAMIYANDIRIEGHDYIEGQMTFLLPTSYFPCYLEMDTRTWTTSSMDC